jgi:hypothetical protein
MCRASRLVSLNVLGLTVLTALCTGPLCSGLPASLMRTSSISILVRMGHIPCRVYQCMILYTFGPRPTIRGSRSNKA